MKIKLMNEKGKLEEEKAIQTKETKSFSIFQMRAENKEKRRGV